jgi:hypothetical protein
MAAPQADTLARQLADAFESRAIPYAIGGSLALAAWGYARATVDVDIDVFVEHDVLDPVFAALETIGCELDRAPAGRGACDRGDFRATLHGMRVDVFIPSIPLYAAAQRRVVPVVMEHGAVASGGDDAGISQVPQAFAGADPLELRLDLVLEEPRAGGRHRRQVAAGADIVGPAHQLELAGVPPEPDAESGQESHTGPGGLNEDGAVHRDPEQVGLELHQEVVGGRPAVHAQLADSRVCVRLHGVHDVAGLVRDGFEGCARNFRPARTPGQADDRATSLHVPVGRSEPDERGHEVDAAV